MSDEYIKTDNGIIREAVIIREISLYASYTYTIF